MASQELPKSRWETCRPPACASPSVSQVDPIKVYFPVSEQEYLRAKHLSSNGQPMDLFDSSPELILADGTVYPHKGKILLTDRQVDTNTGTIRLVAAFPNPGNILRPGQYGRVRIQTSIKEERAAGAAERGQRTSGRLSGRCCGRRQQGDYSPSQSGREGRDDVGD